MKHLRITLADKIYDVTVEVLEGNSTAGNPSPQVATAVEKKEVVSSVKTPESTSKKFDIQSPLTGKIVGIHTNPGKTVQKGEKLITLEAMKMNTFVVSPRTGIIQIVHVTTGQDVTEGNVLITLESF